MKVLVVIPAYNEAESLPAVLRDLAQHLPNAGVLVVDDGSSDRTSEVARLERVCVARLPFNLGIGGALRTGFKYAVANHYDRVVQFDADGQHSAREIGLLMKALDEGADMAVGSRFAGTASNYKTGRLRFRAMRLLRLALRILTGHSYTDTSSGFRAMSMPVARFFADTYPVEYMDSVEALLLALYAGFDVREVAAEMATRTGGRPSARHVHLAYHYLRLMIVLLTSFSMKSRRGRSLA